MTSPIAARANDLRLAGAPRRVVDMYRSVVRADLDQHHLRRAELRARLMHSIQAEPLEFLVKSRQALGRAGAMAWYHLINAVIEWRWKNSSS